MAPCMRSLRRRNRKVMTTTTRECIFPGCGLSFRSQRALERHVNSHMSRKKLKTLRRHSQCWGVKPDFVDLGVMEKIKFQLLRSQMEKVQLEKNPPQPKFQETVLNEKSAATKYFPKEIVFDAEILARRSSPKLAEPELLVQFYPRFVLSDQWIPESKYKPTKKVPIRQIDQNRLQLHFPNLQRPPKAPRKKAHPRRCY